MFNTSFRSARIVDAAKVAALFAFCVSPVPAAAESYSPNVNAAYPDNVHWGDTHVHTYLSGDAFALGSRLTPATTRKISGRTSRTTKSGWAAT